VDPLGNSNDVRPLWNRFDDFISVGADRFAILMSLLQEAGLTGGRCGACHERSVVTLAGQRHIFIPAKHFKSWVKTASEQFCKILT
jgi:hypothetical protein